jgi:hypothetical protein
MAYEKRAPNAYRWTERAYELLERGDLDVTIEVSHGVERVVATGPCPRCDHDVAYRQPLDAVGGEPLAVLGADRLADAPIDPYVGLTVSCSCIEDHEGRPDTIKVGCGINFRVEVRANG